MIWWILLSVVFVAALIGMGLAMFNLDGEE